MKQLICNFKENKLLKLYFLIFSFINIIYLYFEESKSQYVQGHLLEGMIEMHQYQHLTQISKVTSLLELLIVLIYLSYLIKAFIKKDRLSIKEFLVINFIFLSFLFIINYLISIIFSAPIGNLTQQLFIPYGITFAILIYFTVIMVYKKILKSEGT